MARKAPGKKILLKEAGAFLAMLVERAPRNFFTQALWKLRFRIFEGLAFILPDLLKIYLVAGVFWALGVSPPD